jgi:dynein heavy chain
MVNNTVIDWFEPWPEQALRSVATVLLQDLPLLGELREGGAPCGAPPAHRQ